MCQTRIAVVGFNHNSASIKIRERYQLNKKELPDAHSLIMKYKGVEGVIIVNTCNRLEFYLALSNGIKPFSIVRQYYRDTLKNDPIADESCFYTYENAPEVSSHVFKVISGIDSMVMGEYQIQGQIKESYSLACEKLTVDKMLHKLMHTAFRVGKKVRTATSIGEGKQSVSGVASEIMLAKTKPTHKIAIFGVNENTQIMAKTLSKHGYTNLVFANRTQMKAEMMAQEFGGSASDFNSIDRILFNADAVFTCTGSDNFIIHAETLKRLAENGRCPKLIIDMAVPRDVDASEIDDAAEYIDIEKLRSYLDEMIGEIRLKALPQAEKIIEEEVAIYNEWHSAQSDDILGEYSEKFEKIRLQLIDEYRDKLTNSMLEEIDNITKQLLNRTKSTFVRILVHKHGMEKNKNEEAEVPVSRN